MIPGFAFLLGLFGLIGVGASETIEKGIHTAESAERARKINSLNLNIPLQKAVYMYVSRKHEDLDGRSVFNYMKLGGGYLTNDNEALYRSVTCSIMRRAGYDFHMTPHEIIGFNYLEGESERWNRAIQYAMLRLQYDREWAIEQTEDTVCPICYPSLDAYKAYYIAVKIPDVDLDILRSYGEDVKKAEESGDLKRLYQAKERLSMRQITLGITLKDLERYDAGLLTYPYHEPSETPETNSEESEEVAHESAAPPLEKVGARKKKKQKRKAENQERYARTADKMSAVQTVVRAARNAGWSAKDMNKGVADPEQPYHFRFCAQTKADKTVILTTAGQTVGDIVDQLKAFSLHCERISVSVRADEIFLYMSKKNHSSDRAGIHNAITCADEVLNMLDQLSKTLERL